MKIEKLKSLTINALETRLEKLTKEISDLKFDIRIGQEKDYSVLGRKRKELARIKTLLQANKISERYNFMNCQSVIDNPWFKLESSE